MQVEITSKGGNLTVTTLKDGLTLEHHDIEDSAEFDLGTYEIIAVGPQLRSPRTSSTTSSSSHPNEHVPQSPEAQLSFGFLTE